MKKTLLYIVSILALTTSCVDYDDVSKAISVDVQLQMPSEIAGAAMSGHTVTLTNVSGATLSAQTNVEGIATFDNLLPDVYNISTSWNITSAEYALLTGDEVVNEGAVISGNINSQLIAKAEMLSLPLSLSINRSLVIGKIYFAGSKDNNNKNYDAGRYLELFNQSDDSVDVAGLYIGMIETNSTPAYTLAQLSEVYADSVVMLKQVFQIPADKPYKVAPGGTVLIVNSAANHQVNAPQEWDLTGADFEAKDLSGKMVNNAEVPGLNLIYTAFAALSNINFVNAGPNGVVIFRTNQDVTAWPKAYNYGKTKGNEWLVAPKSCMIDAVEVLKRKTDGTVDINTKRLYNDLDATYAIINSASGRNAEVLYRATSTRTGKGGHKILEDTNNSTNDFKVTDNIAPREYE